ncbi:MAG TPA: hypothetical protein VFV38_18295 [Ktedonobacteraceae bacterium]|nr:hypothetical protein [Ktedonobacteraceae bacterium]
MQELLNARKVVECLTRLGELLVELEVQSMVRILMIGGAFMVTQIQNRDTTMDIDVLVYLERDTEDYRKLLTAASFVAVEKQVDYRWLSDGIGDLMRSAAVGQVPEGKLWLKRGLLEVYIPEPRYVLALKLLAAGRTKDAGDVRALFQMYGIKNRKQAEKLLKKYFSKQALEVYVEDIERSFNAFLP